LVSISFEWGKVMPLAQGDFITLLLIVRNFVESKGNRGKLELAVEDDGQRVEQVISVTMEFVKER